MEASRLIVSKRKPTKEAEQAWVSGLLDTTTATHFYGKLTLLIEDGVVVRILKEQSLKPPYE